MPIFEYVCRACHHRFETIVNGSKTPVCPSCESPALDKQLSVFAVSTAGRRDLRRLRPHHARSAGILMAPAPAG
jgi:putative FmdB family regulatory protein